MSLQYRSHKYADCFPFDEVQHDLHGGLDAVMRRRFLAHHRESIVVKGWDRTARLSRDNHQGGADVEGLSETAEQDT